MSPTDDKSLPPIGTLWGDIPPEVRERLPVGTVLGPPADIPKAGPLTRNEDGQWVSRDGATLKDRHLDHNRPILSYPTDEGTWDTPRPVTIGKFADFVYPNDLPSWETAPLLPLYDTPKEPDAETVAQLLGITTKPADFPALDFHGRTTTPKDPAMNDDKIPPRPWRPVNGHVRDNLDRHVVGVTSIRWTIEERDAIIGHIVAAVNAYDTHEARIAELERERDEANAALAYAEVDRDRYRRERDEARAEADRLRAIIVADLPTYPRVSHDEPGAGITPPPGWEWAGEWFPSGAMTANGLPVWRRAVRKVVE